MPDCAWLPALFVSVKVSFFFSSRRRHTRSLRDWSSDVCSSDLEVGTPGDLARTIVALQGAGANPRSFEIGRASCRERVESAAVAGTLLLDTGAVPGASGGTIIVKPEVHADCPGWLVTVLALKGA